MWITLTCHGAGSLFSLFLSPCECDAEHSDNGCIQHSVFSNYRQTKLIQSEEEKSLPEAKLYGEERKNYPQPLQVTCGNENITVMLSKGKVSEIYICTGIILARGI